MVAITSSWVTVQAVPEAGVPVPANAAVSHRKVVPYRNSARAPRFRQLTRAFSRLAGRWVRRLVAWSMAAPPLEGRIVGGRLGLNPAASRPRGGGGWFAHVGMIARMTGLGRGRPGRRAACSARMGLMISRSIRYLAARSRSTRPTSASSSSSARAGTGSASGRPVAVQGATSTWGLRRMRLTLPEVASVWTSSRPSSWTNQTGVATPLRSRLKLVMLRYLPPNTGGGTVVCWWRSGWSRNAISLIVPASVFFSGLRARLAPTGWRWWRRRSHRIRDLLPGDGGEESRHHGSEAVGFRQEGVMAGVLEDLQAAVLEGGGDRRIVEPRRLGVVAAPTNQRRSADLAEAGPQVDVADAGLPAGPRWRRPPLVARLDLDRRDQAGVHQGSIQVELLEPLEPTQIGPPDRQRGGQQDEAPTPGVGERPAPGHASGPAGGPPAAIDRSHQDQAADHPGGGQGQRQLAQGGLAVADHIHRRPHSGDLERLPAAGQHFRQPKPRWAGGGERARWVEADDPPAQPDQQLCQWAVGLGGAHHPLGVGDEQQRRARAEVIDGQAVRHVGRGGPPGMGRVSRCAPDCRSPPPLPGAHGSPVRRMPPGLPLSPGGRRRPMGEPPAR